MAELRTDFITEWVAALRSGDYEQGSGCLRMRDRGVLKSGVLADEVVVRHCCLGVACEVGIRWGVVERQGDDYVATGEAAAIDVLAWNSATLPDGFWQWIGLSRSDPQLGGEGPSLSSYNDEHNASFADIAGMIENAWLREKADA